jgi:hypothetical protein
VFVKWHAPYNGQRFSFCVKDNSFKLEFFTANRDYMLQPKSLFHSFLTAFQLVFSKPTYIAIAGFISIVSWIIFNILDELLFFSPVFAFYLPDDAIGSFIISSITAPLLGAVVAMNVYVFRNSRLKLSRTSFFSGSSISIVSSTCASCSSFGFFLISTFGSAGILASTIMSNYQIPIRLIALGLLVWALYSVSNRLTKSCIITTDYNVGIDKDRKTKL